MLLLFFLVLGSTAFIDVPVPVPVPVPALASPASTSSIPSPSSISSPSRSSTEGVEEMVVTSTSLEQINSLIFKVFVTTSISTSVYVEYYREDDSTVQIRSKVTANGFSHEVPILRLIQNSVYIYTCYALGNGLPQYTGSFITGGLPSPLVDRKHETEGYISFPLALASVYRGGSEFIYIFDTQTGDIVYYIETPDMKNTQGVEIREDSHNIVYNLNNGGIVERKITGEFVFQHRESCQVYHHRLSFDAIDPQVIWGLGYEFINATEFGFELPQMIENPIRIEKLSDTEAYISRPINTWDVIDIYNRRIKPETKKSGVKSCDDPTSPNYEWFEEYNVKFQVEDWLHINYIQVVDERHIILNLRALDAVVLLEEREIDVGNGLEKEWNVAWQVGGINSDFAMDPADHFYDEHGTYLVDENTILIHDNGNKRPDSEGGKAYGSRFLELELDFENMTARRVMEFKIVMPDGTNCFSKCCGDSHVLKNGHRIAQFHRCQQDGKAYTLEIAENGTLLGQMSVEVPHGSTRMIAMFQIFGETVFTNN